MGVAVLGLGFFADGLWGVPWYWAVVGAGPGGGVVYGCCGGEVAGDEEDVLSGGEGLLDCECGGEAEDAGAVIVISEY